MSSTIPPRRDDHLPSPLPSSLSLYSDPSRLTSSDSNQAYQPSQAGGSSILPHFFSTSPLSTVSQSCSTSTPYSFIPRHSNLLARPRSLVTSFGPPSDFTTSLVPPVVFSGTSEPTTDTTTWNTSNSTDHARDPRGGFGGGSPIGGGKISLDYPEEEQGEWDPSSFFSAKVTAYGGMDSDYKHSEGKRAMYGNEAGGNDEDTRSGGDFSFSFDQSPTIIPSDYGQSNVDLSPVSEYQGVSRPADLSGRWWDDDGQGEQDSSFGSRGNDFNRRGDNEDQQSLSYTFRQTASASPVQEPTTSSFSPFGLYPLLDPQPASAPAAFSTSFARNGPSSTLFPPSSSIATRSESPCGTRPRVYVPRSIHHGFNLDNNDCKEQAEEEEGDQSTASLPSFDRFASPPVGDKSSTSPLNLPSPFGSVLSHSTPRLPTNPRVQASLIDLPPLPSLPPLPPPRVHSQRPTLPSLPTTSPPVVNNTHKKRRTSSSSSSSTAPTISPTSPSAATSDKQRRRRGSSSAGTTTTTGSPDARPISPITGKPVKQISKRSWPPKDADRRKYFCKVEGCGKSFGRPSALNTHLRSHDGAKPFTCPVPSCARPFSVFSNLKRHMIVHTSIDFRSVCVGDLRQIIWIEDENDPGGEGGRLEWIDASTEDQAQDDDDEDQDVAVAMVQD